MTISLKNPITQKGYQADALILWCIDARFEESLKQFITDQNLETNDIIRIPGAASPLVNLDSKEFDVLLDQVQTSIKLHQPKKIVLTLHQGCGAYLNQFQDESEEVTKLKQDLQQAKENLFSKTSAANIETWLLRFDQMTPTD